MKITTNNQVVPISQVKPNRWNPKLGFEDTNDGIINFKRLEKSLSKHGQIEPILVRELEDGTFEIINGFHRYTAAKRQGAKEIEIKNLGKISLQEAQTKGISTEDVKIPVDMIMLSKLVVAFDIGELDNLPYSEEEIDGMQKLLDFNWQDEAESGSESTKKEEDDYTIMLSRDRMKEWVSLKRLLFIDSDTELLTRIIDETCKKYGKTRKNDKKDS